MSQKSLPARAKIVIIGGGVGGASVAYHLAKLGEKDLILLDRNELTSGSTFHSAGLVGQLRSDPTLTKMNMYSVQLYSELEKTETPPAWRQCGSIKLASSQERLNEIRNQIGWAKTFGLDLHEISPQEAKERFPLIDLKNVVGACIMETDGQVDPSQLTQAMVSGARKNGAKIFTNTRVTAIRTEGDRIKGVETDEGFIECEIVVNCGGMFAAEIGRLAGVRIPIIPMSHQYLITENFLPPNQKLLPSLRDPDLLIYFRQEVTGLVMGGYERNSKPWQTSEDSFDQIPADFNAKLLTEDWERFEEIALNAQVRVPKMAELGIKKFINGPEGFTPDNEFCLGETEIAGFYVAAGFCAHGIAGAGGIGKVVAEWIVGNEPPMDLWHMDIRRFGDAYKSPKFTIGRVKENYEKYYDIHYPLEERLSSRPFKKSPVYEWHKSHNAVFGEKASWERVNYYKTGNGDNTLRPKGWCGKNWAPEVQIEHAVTREIAGIFDESSFSKLSIEGLRAAEFLDLVCANNIDKGIDRTVYTQVLNSRGGIESDFTVTKTEYNKFLIVTGTAFGKHDELWLRKKREELGFSDVTIKNVTDELAVFGIWGPKSREILSQITSFPLSNQDFPFSHSKVLEIDGVSVRATRITYVGELGWELYVPWNEGLKVWETLIDAGSKFGAKPCGYRAIESLRLEKGYLAWGVELNTETNPFEANLGFAISKTKSDFVGRNALDLVSNPIRKLVTLTIDDITQVPIGNEPIRFENKIIGRIKSAGQGYSINKAIAFAYLPAEFSEVGKVVEVGMFGDWCEARISSSPLYDSTGAKIKI